MLSSHLFLEGKLTNELQRIRRRWFVRGAILASCLFHPLKAGLRVPQISPFGIECMLGIDSVVRV